MPITFMNTFIDPTSLISGSVVLGEHNYIGPYAQVEARQGFGVQLSCRDNLQDNVRILATTRNIILGERTSIAHGASVLNSTIGSFVFVGFNAWVENAILEDGSMVGHGAKVIGVTIPKDRVVPPGAVIFREAQTLCLQQVVEANITFKDEVVSVNSEFACGYHQMSDELGESSVQGVSPCPKTSWNNTHRVPELGDDVVLSKNTRLIGSVMLGSKSSVGRMTSIRGDEGAPIVIGRMAKIGNRVVFHALLGQTIEIGDQLVSGVHVVFHGALRVGNQVIVGDDAVLFKSTIGSNIIIGKGAIIIGVTLADGTRVPDGTLVLNQMTADLLAPAEGSMRIR